MESPMARWSPFLSARRSSSRPEELVRPWQMAPRLVEPRCWLRSEREARWAPVPQLAFRSAEPPPRREAALRLPVQRRRNPRVARARRTPVGMQEAPVLPATTTGALARQCVSNVNPSRRPQSTNPKNNTQFPHVHSTQRAEGQKGFLGARMGTNGPLR